MNRSNIFILTVIVMLVGLFLPRFLLSAPSIVGSVTGGSTTWRLADSPFVLQSSVTVADGDTLIIEPGVVVKFNPSTGLVVNGTLIAAGTVADSIVFTSYRDDAYGGDTNGDGPSSGSPGDWYHISFENVDAGCIMSYCRVRYAGQGYYCGYYCTRGNAILLSGSGTGLTVTNSVIEEAYTPNWFSRPYAIDAEGGTVLEVSQSEIRNNGQCGIVSEGSLTLVNSRVVNNGNVGVSCSGNGAVVMNCRIASNGWDGLYLSGSSCQVVADTVELNGGMGLYCPNLPTQFHDNISTNNGSFGYYIPANVVDKVWLSNVMGPNGRNNAIGVTAGSIVSSTQWVDEHPYFILGNLTVPDNVTFTLEAGVVMKFNPSTGMVVNGILNAVGAEADTIVFTSYRDDAHGGDTNGDGPSSGSPGDWYHISFENVDAGCIMSYCRVRYAGQGYYCGYYCTRGNAILLSGSGTGLTVTNSVIEEAYTPNWFSRPYAIDAEGGTVLEVSQSEIRNNGQCGIVSEGSLTLVNSRVVNNGSTGVYSAGAGSVVANCRFTGNGWDGLYLSGSSCHAVADTFLTNGGHGMVLTQLPTEFHSNYSSANHLDEYVLPVDIVIEAWLHNNTELGGAIGVFGGALTKSTLWIDEHPYDVYGNITVPHDITFTLEPGVIMKFARYYNLSVSGVLIANGTQGDWITFTSYYDDSYGGDTNGDGPSTGTRGDWLHLIFDHTNAGCSMQYCRVRFAGWYHGWGNYYREAVILNGAGAELAMTNCVVEETAGGWPYPNAVAAYSGSNLQMSYCEVRNNGGHGIYVEAPTALVTACVARDNAYYGFYVHPDLVGEIAANDTLRNNGFTNCIGMMGGNITQDDEWPNTYLYLVNGPVTINPGATLVIDKGSVVKFNGNQNIEVQGGLVAQGDAVEKVVFTSIRDDAYGGDTNEDGINSMPARGDWGQIRFNGAVSASRLGWSVVSYAGYGNAPAVQVDNCNLVFSECIVHDNQDRGVRVDPTGQLVMTNSDVYRNPGGVENQNAGANVDARNCWWGDASGPSGVGPGTGDPVSTHVLYDPWLDRSIDNPWVAFTSPSTFGNYKDVLIFNLDEDALMDLVAATEESGIEIYTRTGFETWQAQPSPITSGEVLALAKGDFNNDNHEDLFACGPFGIRCFKGTGTKSLLETTPPLVSSTCNDVMLACVNHDQYLDIIGCSGNNQGIWVLYDDSLGNWTPGIRPTTTGSYNRVRAADINNDTYLDIVATSAEYQGIQIWYGSAAGTWTKATPIANGSAFFGLDVGDIDKDGDYDIAVGSNQANIGIQIYLNNGAGGWSTLAGPTSVGIYNDVILADLNGDTRLDLAAASQGGGINVWVGTSSLCWNFWYHPITIHNFNRICIGDFTLNGSLDIAAASSVFGLALWDNLTPGVFQEYFATTPDKLNFGSIAIGKCAHQEFQVGNVSPDTLRNVVVYTTNPAFSVRLDPPNVQPFDLLPNQVRHVDISYCPVDSVAESEVIIVHSSVAVTHVRATGKGVPYIQPLWSMNISVENATGAPDSIGLEFGGGIGATDSMDAAIGEICLPPLPPSEVFDARFLIAGCEGSLVNIHDYYAETDSFILEWQAGAGSYPVTISWDPRSLPDGTFLISDVMGGVFVDTLNMADTSRIVIPPEQSFITKLSITTLRKSTFANHLHRGWQIRSLAVACDEDSLQDLFPGAISAFTWADGYVQVGELGVGTGYWVNMAGDTVLPHVGEQVRVVKRTLPKGWSLVGALFDTMQVTDIQQNPSSSIISIYGFSNRYYLADALFPGQGYWFNLSQPCEVTISVPFGGSPPSRPQTVATGDSQELPEKTYASNQSLYGWRLPLVVETGSASTNASRTLVIGFQEEASDGVDLELGERDVPPWPPSNIFESRLLVRNANGLYVDLRKPDSGVHEFEVSWQAGEGVYPVAVSWEPEQIPEWATLTLRDNLDGSLIGPLDMKKQSVLVVDAPNGIVSGLRITAEIEQVHEPPVTQFALMQNVPNPFNPSTTIRFDLPEEVHVKLCVYDLSGRIIRVLVDRILPEGRHSVEWTGLDDQSHRVSSGIYFYRIEAGTWAEKRKLVLLK